MIGRPTISIAIATYNGAAHLRVQLESIARQTVRPDEVVFCDDGSSDGTIGLIDEFARSCPVNVVRDFHASRLGPNDNVLRALRSCTGEVIAVCDQDDWWHPRKLEICVRRFAKSDVCGVVHGIQVTDDTLRVLPGRAVGLPRSGVYDHRSINPWMCVSGMQMVVRADAVRPHLYRQQSGRPYAFHMYDEYLFFLCGCLGAVAVCSLPLAKHRRHTRAATAPGGRIAEHYEPGRVRAMGWSATASGYATKASAARLRAALLRDMEAENPRLRLKDPVRFYDAVAARYLRRATLYDEAGPGTVRLGGMVVRGDYIPKHHGGFGLAGLAKDAYKALGRGFRQIVRAA